MSDADLDLLLDYQDHADPANEGDEYDPFGLGGNMNEYMFSHVDNLAPEGPDQAPEGLQDRIPVVDTIGARRPTGAQASGWTSIHGEDMLYAISNLPTSEAELLLLEDLDTSTDPCQQAPTAAMTLTSSRPREKWTGGSITCTVSRNGGYQIHTTQRSGTASGYHTAWTKS